MKHALLNLRQLSSLGISSHLKIPQMLRCLDGIVHSDFSVYWWANPQGEIVDYFSNDPNTVRHAASYVTDFANDVRPKSWLSARQILCRNVVDNNIHRIVPARYKTDIYQRVMHPCRMHFVVQMPIRSRGSDGGVILLSRSDKDNEFTPHDERRMTQVAPHFSHAMAFREELWDSTDFQADDDIGLALIDRNGRVIYANTEASQFLHLVSRDEPNPKQFDLRLKALADNESAIGKGRIAAPSAFTIANRWGQFAFRAYRLQSTVHSDERLTGLQIRQFVPMRLKLMKRIQSLELPQRLSEYCLHLVSGLSHVDAAQAMGISRNTAKGYFGVLCNKLGIAGGKNELLRAIIADSTPNEAIVIVTSAKSENNRKLT